MLPSEVPTHDIASIAEASHKVVENLRVLAAEIGTMDKNAIRRAIHDLGCSMEALPQCEADLAHIYADGLYGRKWTCAAGNVIVTEIHKYQHISSLIKGKIVIASTDGVQILEAPQFFVTEPGTQRVILTLEDTVFTTVHVNHDNEKDPDVLKARLSCRNFNELATELAGELR